MGRKHPAILIAMALAAVMTVVACGGGSEPRMTVEEYATACEGFGSSLGSQFTQAIRGTEGEEALRSMERAVARAKDWNPPAELQEFHEATYGFAEWSLRALQDIGWFDLTRDLGKAMEERDQERMTEFRHEAFKLKSAIEELEDEADEREDEIERIADNLSPITQGLLQDAYCY